MKKPIKALQDYMSQQADPNAAVNKDPQLEGYHRDLIFDEERRSEFLWCLHCERTYKRGEFRWEGNFQMCPYDGCDGSTVLDGIDWERFRDDYTEYPVIPESDKRYPMYAIEGDDDDGELCAAHVLVRSLILVTDRNVYPTARALDSPSDRQECLSYHSCAG